MIVAFSTSSPQASVALIGADGEVLARAERPAPMSASGVSLELLDSLLSEVGARLEDAELFVTDVGPGSFTGVRVGVVLAKTLALVLGRLCAAATSFDLIDPVGPVAIPARKGHWYLRAPGMEPEFVTVLPEGKVATYGHGAEEDLYPEAWRCAELLSRLERVVPEALVPAYLAEPSISTPKRPYAPRTGAVAGG